MLQINCIAKEPEWIYKKSEIHTNISYVFLEVSRNEQILRNQSAVKSVRVIIFEERSRISYVAYIKDVWMDLIFFL